MTLSSTRNPVRKAPFPIALILRKYRYLSKPMRFYRGKQLITLHAHALAVLTAITSTLLSIYLPSLIHVIQPAPGPLHHEVK